MTKANLLNTGSTIGPFTIERSVPKKGGMSEIYLAHMNDQPLSKMALKLNLVNDKNNDNPRNVYQDLLRKEVRLLQYLRHPGVVRIFPFTLERDTKIIYSAKSSISGKEMWYFVMEYLPGGNLSDNLHNISRMPTKWAVELFYQILIAVQYIHRLGYAHCDLKPENIMMRETPNPNCVPQPILIDFGCVEKIGSINQTPCATPSYSPPEVLMAMQRADLGPSDLDIRSDKIDIWSLGAIFFSLMTGKAMFANKNRSEVTSNVIKGEIAKIQSYRPDLHSSLDTLLAAMMHKNPASRAELDDIIVAIEEKISSIRPPRVPTIEVVRSF
jgi:serine/threonine protein kinase